MRFGEIKMQNKPLKKTSKNPVYIHNAPPTTQLNNTFQPSFEQDFYHKKNETHNNTIQVMDIYYIFLYQYRAKTL